MSLVTSFRRLPFSAGLIGVLAASLSGCGGGGSSSNQITRGACVANPHVAGRARWTVLVYMNSANNLQPFSLLNVGQMASVGSDTNVNIILQWKTIDAKILNNPNTGDCTDCTTPFIGTRRYLIRKHSAADVTAIEGGNVTPLNPDRLADPATNYPAINGTSDMGDYHTLADFVQWGTANYPADHMALVIWDHGSGWIPVLRSISKVKPSTRAVSQDEGTHNEIETTELPLALSSAAQPLDMLIIDCSLEQMAEVAYEVRNSARVMVGSEESPPGAGYPYDAWLNAVKASGLNPCDVGNSIVTTFVKQYGTSQTDVTQSVIDLSRMQNVAAQLNAFATTLLLHIGDQATVIQNARTNCQHYVAPYDANKDLYDFADQIKTTTTKADLRSAATAVEAALTGNGGAILYNGHGNSGQAGSHGQAIYLPNPGSFDSRYNTLALTAAAQNWQRFITRQTQ